MVRGRAPRISELVITIIANDRTMPIVHANRLGLADTHCAGWPLVSRRDTMPTGLRWMPAVMRMRNSMKKKVVTIWIGANTFSQFAKANTIAPMAIVMPAAMRTSTSLNTPASSIRPSSVGPCIRSP